MELGSEKAPCSRYLQTKHRYWHIFEFPKDWGPQWYTFYFFKLPREKVENFLFHFSSTFFQNFPFKIKYDGVLCSLHKLSKNQENRIKIAKVIAMKKIRTSYFEKYFSYTMFVYG